MSVTNFDLRAVLEVTAERGYAFVPDALSVGTHQALLAETQRLTFELGDNVNHPIWAGSKREVRQQHARSYHYIQSYTAPAALAVSLNLAETVRQLEIPELTGWLPTEAGYQCYRGLDDFISPHRDRRNDRLLSVTLTITGSAVVRVLEPVADPDDYTNLRPVDEFLTQPGTLMFLRAPGFGKPGQIIHEVLPPVVAPRFILNLRTRPDVLPQPSGGMSMQFRKA